MVSTAMSLWFFDQLTGRIWLSTFANQEGFSVVDQCEAKIHRRIIECSRWVRIAVAHLEAQHVTVKLRVNQRLYYPR